MNQYSCIICLYKAYIHAFRIKVDNIILFEGIITQHFKHRSAEKGVFSAEHSLFEQNSFRNIGRNSFKKSIKV